MTYGDSPFSMPAHHIGDPLPWTVGDAGREKAELVVSQRPKPKNRRSIEAVPFLAWKVRRGTKVALAKSNFESQPYGRRV